MYKKYVNKGNVYINTYILFFNIHNFVFYFYYFMLPDNGGWPKIVITNTL